MSYEVPLESLFTAYFECRKNKRATLNALHFELEYESNLIDLQNELRAGTYNPGRSIAFVIDKPVKREIFAADFKDRVVHHWLINKLNPLFEQAFIYDSYACRTNKGTHFGIARADRFIRKCSQNYTKDAYVLKLDIQGFFMAINRRILWERLCAFIEKKYIHEDKELVLFLCHKMLTNNPTKNCLIKGGRHNWDNLPPNKSLFYSPLNCGLPIGNLTSQVFANFYLNPFDHFMKKELGLAYYGRFVDDFIVVHECGNHLKSLIPIIKSILKKEFNLTLHPKKTYLQHCSKGTPFLGVIIKPNRIYAGKRTKGNWYSAITKHNQVVATKRPNKEEQAAFLCSMNSYLGLMKHYKTHSLRKKMLKKHLSLWWWNLFYLSSDCSKIALIKKAHPKTKNNKNRMCNTSLIPKNGG